LITTPSGEEEFIVPKKILFIENSTARRPFWQVDSIEDFREKTNGAY